MPPLVEIENLVKMFRPRRGSMLHSRVRQVAAVRGISLAIREREIVGLVGESGSGKSTLGRCILHLETPTAGAIRFRGREISSLSPREFRPLRREIQMVFQDPTSSLNPRDKVRVAVEEPLHLLTDLPEAERSERVARVLEEVGLSGLAGRYRHQLSGGQRQRVSIARAIVVEPSFIALDEPVSSLDASVRGRMLELLRALQEAHDLAYLFISHDLETVHAFCERVAIMYRGSLVEVGRTADIFERPLHPYTQLLLSSSLPADPGARPAWRGSSSVSVDAALTERRSLMEHVRGLELVAAGEPLLDVGDDHYVAPLLGRTGDDAASLAASKKAGASG